MVDVERVAREVEELARALEGRGLCRGEACAQLAAAALLQEAAERAYDAMNELNEAIRRLEELLEKKLKPYIQLMSG